MSSDAKRFWKLLGSLLLAAMFGYGLYDCTRDLMQALDASRNWVETPCVLRHVGMEKRYARRGSNYSLDLRYVYSYGGEIYGGHRYDVWGRRFSHEAAQELVQAMQQKGTWTCYVNPADPREAVIDPRVMWPRFCLLGSLLLVFFLSSLYWVYYHCRGPQPPQKKKPRRKLRA